MRREFTASALLFTLVLGACSGRHEQSATRLDVQKKSVTADLTAAPRNYTPTRFVSPIEQSGANGHAGAPARSFRADRIKAGHEVAAVRTVDVVRDPIASLTSHQIAPVSATPGETMASSPSMTVATHLTAEPAPMKMGPGMSAGDAGMGMDHAGEASHPVSIGTSVIRGGLMGGDRKCDPRTDTHTTPQELGRPDFAMPSQGRRTTFGGRQ